MEQRECKDNSEEQDNVKQPVEEICENVQSLQEEGSPHSDDYDNEDDDDDDNDDDDDADCSNDTHQLFAPSCDSNIPHDTSDSEGQSALLEATSSKTTRFEATQSEATYSEATQSEATYSEATQSEATYSETTQSEAMASEATSFDGMSSEAMFFEAMSSDMSQLTQLSGRKRGKKLQGTDECQPPKFSKLKFQLADLNSKVGIKNRVCGLQRQLIEVQNENQMLNKLQHHHTVALQHFEEMESRIAETLARHARHVKVLQIMLRETRTCRDHLAKQLLKTEHKLLNMRDALQDLQHFSQNGSLLEREDLTNLLAQATAELEEKDKRIQVLEKNLHLCQAYFNHQLVCEQKKLDEERQFSCYLQEQFNQLTKETKDRTRKLEESNAYLKFLLKESTKRDRQNKMVQTEGLSLLPAEAARLLEFHLAGTEMKMRDSANLDCVYPEQKKQEGTVNVSKENSNMKADTREQKGCSKKRPDDATGEEEAPEALDAKCLKTAKLKREKIKKINNYYPFNQTIINLYHGKPAHSSVDLSPCEDTDAGNHVYVVRLPAGKLHQSQDAQ